MRQPKCEPINTASMPDDQYTVGYIQCADGWKPIHPHSETSREQANNTGSVESGVEPAEQPIERMPD